MLHFAVNGGIDIEELLKFIDNEIERVHGGILHKKAEQFGKGSYLSEERNPQIAGCDCLEVNDKIGFCFAGYEEIECRLTCSDI